MKNLKDNLLTYLKGMAMGAADVVPGVSGGSIALIAGIYEKLLDSINAIDMEAFDLLRKGEIKTLWLKVNGSFLLALLLGIFTSILTLANVITYLIKNHPIPVWSFFCGLIVISALIILRDVKKWNVLAMLALPIGIGIAYWITGMAPGSSNNNLFFIFGAGMIAICAMILPGISGSFLLLVMGKYEYILNALVEKDILTLGVFALGCVIGIMAASRVISWLLKHYPAISISVLSGFMLGSINKLWPWKKVLSYRLSSSGEQEPFLTENIWPHHYLSITGEEPFFLAAIFAFCFGVVLVIGLERMAYYMKSR
jgi:putative membrane protein